MSSRSLLLSRNSFLSRHASRHFRGFHPDRRHFLTTAAVGAGGLAFWVPEPPRPVREKARARRPNQYPGAYRRWAFSSTIFLRYRQPQRSRL